MMIETVKIEKVKNKETKRANQTEELLLLSLLWFW